MLRLNAQETPSLAVEELLAETATPAAKPIDGVVTATLVGFDDAGCPRVTFTGNPFRRPLAARTLVPLSKNDVGCEVAVSFDRGDAERPIVLGKMWSPTPEKNECTPHAPREEYIQEAYVDGERVVVDANKELILRCGEASITLTKAGKIILRGTYLLSRSSGVNRIKGGSVQIN